LILTSTPEGKWAKYNPKKRLRSEPDPANFQPMSLQAFVGRWIFLNFTTDDFEPLRVLAAQDGQELEPTGDSHSSAESHLALVPSVHPMLLGHEVEDAEKEANTYPYPSSSLSIFPGNNFVERHLFAYFVSAICPSCSLSSSQNPYLTFLTPMSFQYPALSNALLAVSANQLRLLNDKRFEREAWYFKSKAIAEVQRAVRMGDMDVGTIATVLMLCFYDVCLCPQPMV
jgi:hypothetical protein